MSKATTATTIRPAASLIIASPITVNNSVSSFTTSNSKHEQGSAGCNYRILMMKRNASSFINAHVYPGGVIDRADHYSHWLDHFGKQAISVKEGHFLTNKICAIRETFEESGLLLSDPPLTQLTGSSKASFLNSLPTWRQKVHHDASQFKVMCETFNIRPAVDSLIPFSNWITPVIEKKRYDTMFFLTVLDQYTSAEEEAKHLNLVSADGKETVLFDWFTPEEALQQQCLKKIITIPPQWYSLTVLSAIFDHHDLRLRAGVDIFKAKNGELLKILPQANTTDSDSAEAKQGFKFYLAYPGDEIYQSDSNEYKKQKGNRHRVYVKGRMEEYMLERNVNASDIIAETAKF